MNYILSQHAADVIRARGIKREWLVSVLANPAMLLPQEGDPTVTHALAPVAEHGGRVLRVVYNHTAQPWRIVTVYFDRAMKGKL